MYTAKYVFGHNYKEYKFSRKKIVEQSSPTPVVALTNQYKNSHNYF